MGRIKEIETTTKRVRRLLILVICAFVAVTVHAAKVKIKVEHDKTFDFSPAKTYMWHPSGAGDVKVLQNSGDDPVAIRKRLEPIIVGAVDQTIVKRGLVAAKGGAADLRVTYYVLVGPNISSQQMGQFLGPVAWGLPPFAAVTTAVEIYEQGTLVIDIASVSQDAVVWRGSAQTQLDQQLSESARADRIRSAVQDMFKNFPPKLKK